MDFVWVYFWVQLDCPGCRSARDMGATVTPPHPAILAQLTGRVPAFRCLATPFKNPAPPSNGPRFVYCVSARCIFRGWPEHLATSSCQKDLRAIFEGQGDPGTGYHEEETIIVNNNINNNDSSSRTGRMGDEKNTVIPSSNSSPSSLNHQHTHTPTELL